MTNDNLRTLVRYRLEQADEALGAAQLLLDQHSLRAVVNRAYYAMFYAVLALLALRKQETSRHAGAISLFDREFVRPGVFSTDLLQWLHRAFRRRLAADHAVCIGSLSLCDSNSRTADPFFVFEVQNRRKIAPFPMRQLPHVAIIPQKANTLILSPRLQSFQRLNERDLGSS